MMSNFRNICLFVGSLFLIAIAGSCNRQNLNGLAVICGSSDQRTDAFIRLVRIDTMAFTPIDSVKPGSDGSFCLRFKPETSGFYLLRSDHKILATLVIYPGDSIQAQIEQGSVDISGGSEAGVFNKYRQSLLFDESIVDSLATIAILARDLDNYTEIKQRTDSAWAALILKAKNRSIAYIKSNPDFLSQLLVVNSKIQRTFIFDQTTDSTWLYLADAQLTRSHGNNPHVVAYSNRIKSIRITNQLEMRARENLKPGKKAPAIKLPGINGKAINLTPSENKYTLVYFWSPTDGPSRKANIELKSIHQKYKGSGFEVFAVSLDSFTERWVAAVKLDKLWWTNVNDTLGFNSLAAKDWHVQKLPVFILVDEQGKIIERYSSSRALDERLKTEYGK